MTLEWILVGVVYAIVALIPATEVARRTPTRSARARANLLRGRAWFDPPARIECAWCKRTVTEGREPATHTICPACSAAIEGTDR